MDATTRVGRLRDDQLTDEQRRLAAEIAGARGGVLGGPFAIWLRVPEIAERINHLSARLRKGSRLDKRLVEVLVLVITSSWQADYAWTAHAKQALAEGISAEAIEAIRGGVRPEFARDDETLVYDICSELSAQHALGDATYARGIDAFGLETMIELVTTAGLYTMIAMTLTAFDVPVPDGTPA